MTTDNDRQLLSSVRVHYVLIRIKCYFAEPLVPATTNLNIAGKKIYTETYSYSYS